MPNDIDTQRLSQRRTSKLLAAMGIFVLWASLLTLC